MMGSALVWQWPQIVFASLAGLSLLCAMVLHGRPRSASTHHFATTALILIMECALLYFGGFWTEVRP